MKLTLPRLLIPILMGGAWAAPSRSSAAEYALPGRFPSAGGGTSVSGPYALSGLLRIAPTGILAGGAYQVVGRAEGWAGPSAPTTAPTLSWEIGRTGIVVSWPAAAADYVLEEAAELGDEASWTPSEASYTVGGEAIQVTLEPTLIRRFYRLRRVP